MLNINVTDEEDFSIEFIDNQTGETTIYDSSVATASAIPYIAYIVGSQVVRLAIKGVAKKTVQVSVNLGKVLKHNSRGVLFEGSSSKGWKHIYDGHVLGKGAKKGDTLFPKNLSQTQIKNIIMESLEKGVNNLNKRGTGVAFIAISAFLFSVKYISAAIFSSGVSSWDEDLFNAMLSYVGSPLSICSILALILGIAYIAWGEYEELIQKNK